MTGIEKALEALSLLKPGEHFEYTEYAKKFGCNRSTLSKRHRGVQGSMEEKIDHDSLLNTTQQRELIRYIKQLCERGLPPSKPMIRNFAAQIAHKYVGKCWADRFVRKNRIDLISAWASTIDANRFKADSAYKYKLYFELLKRKIDQYDVDPRHIYNMDEKGFMLGMLSKVKRVFSKEIYKTGKYKSMLQDGNREWITTIACICADGTALSPALIYQSQSGHIQDSWLQDFYPEKDRTFFATSPSGWTSNKIGLAWLKQVFDRETKAKARSSYRLLILDGHGSHVTMDFIEYCDANKILLMVFPPHATHSLQPLDVVVFAPLAASYKAELAAWLERCQGLTAITKRDFYRLFITAWTSTMKEKLICKSFEATGIVPLVPNAVLSRFKAPPTDGSRPASSDSSSSVLSASDWRKIERLLRQAVSDLGDEKAKKLSRTIHTISVQKDILQHENDQLKEALANEKKRRKRGKALLLEPTPEYNGGAQFFSPNKVSQAREKQAEKDLAEQELQHQKDEANKLKAEKKKAKAKLLEERRIVKVAVKERKEVEAAQRAAAREEEKIAKQLEKQLQNNLKTSQNNKRQSLMKQKKPKVVVVDEDPSEVEEVVERFSRGGRVIRPPKRLLS
jgi:hypothetical protein